MLTNRKVLLSMIQQTESPISLIKIQLLMFLTMQKSPTKHYWFIPTEKGPFSLVLEDDAIAMDKKGLLILEYPAQTIRINIGQYTEKMMPQDEDRHLLNTILEEYQTKDDQELLKIAITMNPFYGIHLPSDKLSLLDSHTQSEVGTIQESIKDAPRALYTIGYEKITLDEFILFLLAQGIQTVIDVRETTTSRRREFSKAPLERALTKVTIGYISIPELGIPTEIRNKILKTGNHQDLLRWYRTNEEHKNRKYTSEVANLVSKGNTALMCYEKDHNECHRSIFAQLCKERNPEIPAIVHLRDDEKAMPETV